MGFFSTIGSWVSSAARVVSKVVSGVSSLLSGPSVSDEYRRVVRELDTRPAVRTASPLAIDAEMMAAATRQTQQRVDEALRQVEQVRREQRVTQQQMVLRSRVMELALQASAFDRYTHNMQLHAANLGIHLQTIRNVNGLVDDVNALRHAAKRSMGTINHLINIVENAGLGRARRLENIDVEREYGAISFRDAHEAFEHTRRLLAGEIRALVRLADQHLHDVRTVQAEADAWHGEFGRQIRQTLEDRIVPRLQQTRSAALFIGEDVDRNFPVLPGPSPRAASVSHG
jgi:hypothetical protein